MEPRLLRRGDSGCPNPLSASKSQRRLREGTRYKRISRTVQTARGAKLFHFTLLSLRVVPGEPQITGPLADGVKDPGVGAEGS